MRLIARKSKKTDGPEAMNLAEESVHLLRSLPAKAWIQYALGTFPFVLGLLYFFADISRGAYGETHLAPASLIMAFLYLWLKFWQGVFAQSMAAKLYGREGRPWTLRRIWNVTIINAVVHPVGMLLIPISALLFVPLPTVLAFFHNLTFVADGEEPSLRANIVRAGGLARKWYSNNLGYMFVIKFFVFFVYLNWVVTLSFLPDLARMLLGTDIAPLQAADLVLNSTFQAVVFLLTWLCVSPINRAAYALRCYYGESIHSGADLKAELKFLRGAGLKAAVAGFALLCFSAAPSSAAEPAEPTQRTDELDQQIQDVLKRPEFSWRSPRQEATEEDHGMAGRMSKAIVNFANKALEKIGDAARALVEWLMNLADEEEPQRRNSDSSSFNWGGLIRGLMWTLIAAVAIALIYLGVRLWNQQPQTVVLAETVTPDLTAEDVTADELPEDEWLTLAHDLLNKGDSRLALRALYLACLAHLGERELVTISRAKSNREYQRELNRRARLMEELLHAFSENMHSFERVWYGVHEVTRTMFEQFEQNLHRIRQC